ncbi:MAG: nucleotidyltransferase family protein [Anaerolineales bacterium]|nr:nucleotidyltransferase family protein [Anaerolineales bacterium]
MDAIVTAGGVPLVDEPLYDDTRGEAKALLDIAGKPMVQWILDALSATRTIENVILVGLTAKLGLQCDKPMYFVSNQGRMLDNFRAGVKKSLEVNPKPEHVLFVSADIPAITSEMIDWVVETAMETDDDVYYNVIERSVMEKRFPACTRTWTKLKDMEVCGGDMNVARSSMVVDDDDPLWRKISDARKSPLKQASLIGLGTAIKFFFGQLTLEDVVARVEEKLGIDGRVIVCPFAEIGMDVDKPIHLEILRKDFKKRLRRAAGKQVKKGQKPAGKAIKAEKPVAKTRKPAAKGKSRK